MQNDARSGSWTPWLAGLVVLATAAALVVAFDHRREPRRVTVQHILIAFQGSGTKATRSIDEAQKLAERVLSRAKSGEDFGQLLKEFSDDSPDVYTLCNKGVACGTNEYQREAMVPAFGDVSFKLGVGGIELAPYDPKAGPYGWHILKRLK
jgi:parvulin-like peptidyl-prolyl isomerase